MMDLFNSLSKLLEEYQPAQPSLDEPEEVVEIEDPEPAEFDGPEEVVNTGVKDSTGMLVAMVEERLGAMHTKQAELESICRMLTDEITVLKNSVKGLDKIVDGTLIKEGASAIAFDKLINSI